MTLQDQLQRELGDGFRVLRWVTSKGNAGPDEVVVERRIDRCYISFEVDDLAAKHCLPQLADNMRDQFARVKIKNERLQAFETIVRNEKLPLSLERLSNEKRYAALETEWAFQFWCRGLDVKVTPFIGNTTKPTESA